MKSIKRIIQYGVLAAVAGVITYQASANLLNVGGEDDKSGVSVFGKGNENESGSLVRVGGLSVGGEHVVDYERKKDRACDKGRYDARHNRSSSYFREKNENEYKRCKADEQAKMKAEGKQPTKRGRTTTESRRAKKMQAASENE